METQWKLPSKAFIIFFLAILMTSQFHFSYVDVEEDLTKIHSLFKSQIIFIFKIFQFLCTSPILIHEYFIHLNFNNEKQKAEAQTIPQGKIWIMLKILN